MIFALKCLSYTSKQEVEIIFLNVFLNEDQQSIYVPKENIHDWVECMVSLKLMLALIQGWI